MIIIGASDLLTKLTQIEEAMAEYEKRKQAKKGPNVKTEKK